MTTETSVTPTQREPELLGQTVVLIGGSAGIGLATAQRARAEGAEVVLTGPNPERLKQAALDVGARSTAAFDATDSTALKRFFEDLPDPIDHVLVAGPGPRYGPPVLERDADGVRLALTDHMVLPLEVARNAAPKMRRCRLRCSEINSRSAGTSCGRSFRSAASSGPRTSRRSPFTS